MDRIRTLDLFDLEHTLAAPLLAECEYPWDALGRIGHMLAELAPYPELTPGVWVAETAVVSPTATLIAPCVVGAHTQVRPGAYIRGNVLVGGGCVVGNSTELKNCILFDKAEVPHYNYVGDSILGYRAHMGAGAITSNIKADKRNIVVHADSEYATGLRKFGAMLGDGADIGCNSVLNPGTIIGRGARVYPLSCVRGVVPEYHILKGARGIFPLRRD